VYFLTGVDPESGEHSVYIGEAESIRNRIKYHINDSLWDQIVIFISRDKNLTKAHIRYLEGRLIELAKKSCQARIRNIQGSGSRLPESDREDMEIFLKRILFLLPFLGVDLLIQKETDESVQIGTEDLPKEQPNSKIGDELTFLLRRITDSGSKNTR